MFEQLRSRQLSFRFLHNLQLVSGYSRARRSDDGACNAGSWDAGLMAGISNMPLINDQEFVG